MSSQKKQQLVVIMTGSVVAFLTLPFSGYKIPAEGVLIHRGATADVYTAFGKHFTEKFHSKPTMDDAKDLWVVWAKDNNIPDSEPAEEYQAMPIPDIQNGDSFYIPEVPSDTTHVHGAIGISQQRKDLIKTVIDRIGTDGTISFIMSETSKICESHAELMFAGFLIGIATEKARGKHSHGLSALLGSRHGAGLGRLAEIISRIE